MDALQTAITLFQYQIKHPMDSNIADNPPKHA